MVFPIEIIAPFIIFGIFFQAKKKIKENHSYHKYVEQLTL